MSTSHSSSSKKSTARIRFACRPEHASSQRTFRPFGQMTASHQTPNPLDRTGGVVGQIDTVRLVMH